MRTALVVVFALSVVAQDATAAPGDLVPSFGTGGSVLIDAGTGPGFSRAVAIQPDGKVVIGGNRVNPLPNPIGEFVLVRYAPGGARDGTFGASGVVATPLGNNAVVLSLSILPDGKILASGVARVDRGYDIALAKYQSDGAPDPTFGTNGTVVTHTGTSNDSSHTVAAMALAPDGRIAIATDDFTGSQKMFIVLRYLPDGRPDTQFGSGGTVTTGMPDAVSTNATAMSVVVQADGKIVAGGRCDDTLGRQVLALVRYNVDGSIDTSFGTAGKVLTAVGVGHVELDALALQPDGRIVAIGEIPGGNAITTVLARYNVDGSLDASFGEGGVVLTNRSPPAVSSLTFDANGSIVVAGSGIVDNVGAYALLRYHGNGAIDAGFGVGGLALVPIGTSNSSAKALAIQFDGSIVAVGLSDQGASTIVEVEGGYASGPPYAVEYFHWLFNHYFISLDMQEIHDLDTGVHPNWVRTGLGFRAHATPGAGAEPVCRFYIPPGKGDSHFFSASTQECADTHAKFPDLVYETASAFYIGLPDIATGACPQGSLSVYRVWNNRSDSNHRYTTSRTTRDDMVNQGYIAEGYGPDQVAMCAPQ